MAEVQQKQAELEQAKADAAEDNAIATDDYYRIPAIMQDCKTAYNLTWQGPGTWEGYTYVRKATMPNINGVITFKATLSIVRKPKYFWASRYIVPSFKSAGNSLLNTPVHLW